MASNAIQFNNFIIGKIIKSIHYDVVKNVIRLDEVSISEDEIEEIVVEGERHNLDRNQVIELIQVLSENISFNPSIESDYSTIDINHIERGKYLRVYFDIDNIGCHYIGLVYLCENQFLVIDSTIGCVQYSDIIESTNKLWHPSHSVDFIIKRNNIRFPNSKSYLRVGKIEKVDWFTPAYVYDIINKKVKTDKNKKSLNPVKDLLTKIRSSKKAATLSEDYYSILGSWLQLGGNSYTLSLILKQEISLDENKSSKSKDLSFFYEVPSQREVTISQDIEKKIVRKRAFGWQWILFIIIFLILATITRELYLQTLVVSAEKDELDNINKKLKDSITDINSYYKAIFEVENVTGAPIKLSSNSKDNGWGMWVFSYSPLIIKSFDVMAGNSGSMRIGLYNSNGVLLEEKDINVVADSFVSVYAGFKLINKDYYYLCITQSNGNNLSYHSSSDKEYESYNGHLKIMGCCAKDNISSDTERTKTNYYQYFYNIKYQLLYK